MEDITKYFEDKYERNITKILFNVFVAILIGGVLSTMMHSALMSLPPEFLDNYDLKFTISYYVILGLLPVTTFLMNWPKDKVQGINHEEDIFSLKSDVRTKGQMSGSFILGCGSISGSSEEIDYYVYYKKQRFGLEKDKIKAYGIEVIQRDDIKPSYKEVLVDGELYKVLFVPSNTIKKKITMEV